MKVQIVLGSIFMMFVLVLPANASGKDDLQKYFNDTANKVKATENVIEKRKILDESFQKMINVLDKVQNFSLISKEDRTGVEQFKATLQDKQDELAGTNGYERVPDLQLNNFSNYVVQRYGTSGPGDNHQSCCLAFNYHFNCSYRISKLSKSEQFRFRL